jgi:hypothetical protein
VIVHVIGSNVNGVFTVFITVKAVTLNIYAHLMKPANQEAVCRLEERVFGENGDQMVTSTKKEVSESTVTSCYSW